MKIHITDEAFLKLRYFIDGCKTELSGFGKIRELSVVKVENTEDYDEYDDVPRYKFFKPKRTLPALEIYDIELMPQEAGMAHATISEETLAKFLFEKTQKGESVKDYKVWWHSHVHMQAFFSMTDDNTINGSTEFPYLVSIVGNKQGDMNARVDFFKPYRDTQDVQLIRQTIENKKLRTFCASEIKRCVKEAKFPQRNRLQKYKEKYVPRVSTAQRSSHYNCERCQVDLSNVNEMANRARNWKCWDCYIADTTQPETIYGD